MIIGNTTTIAKLKPGTKVLFANVPADGHFNPLTGIAKYLSDKGCDVRWYTSETYAEKIQKLGIYFYPLKKALDISAGNIDEVFADRKNYKSQIAKLKYDIINAFILRGPEYFDDIQEIYHQFPFDVLIADSVFTAIPLVKECMKIPVLTVGIIPITETSKDLPPAGLGMIPSYSFAGKIKQNALRFIADKILFRQPYLVMKKMLAGYGIEPDGNLFDTLIRKSTLVLQSGTPGFEYYRSDLNRNIRFVGPLLPHRSGKKSEPWFDVRLKQYSKIILVTQGTVEKDVNKIIVPTLEAFKDTDVLVVVTTGGSGTQELKANYHQENIIIEDFIPFDDVMPYAQVYITNGGYGGVMLGIQNGLPLVVAGIHEGKNEINARIGFFKLGINLQTETPTPAQMKKAIDTVFQNEEYKENVEKLRAEFESYHPNELVAQYVAEVVNRRTTVMPAWVMEKEQAEAIY